MLPAHYLFIAYFCQGLTIYDNLEVRRVGFFIRELLPTGALPLLYGVYLKVRVNSTGQDLTILVSNFAIRIVINFQTALGEGVLRLLGLATEVSRLRAMQNTKDVHECLSGICFLIQIKEALLLQVEELEKLSSNINRRQNL